MPSLVNADAIPNELKRLPNWVNWRERLRNGRPTKIPCQPNGRPAKANDPVTWSTFDEAWAAYVASPSSFSGVGYVFGKDDPYCGVDLDACLRRGTRLMTPWAKQVLESIRSYTEIRPQELG